MRKFDQLKRNPFKGIWSIFTSFNFKFMLFAVGYPCAYRVCVEYVIRMCNQMHCIINTFHFQILNCLFNRISGLESKYANIAAAFLAGGFFYFHPKLPFLTYAIACTIEIVWQRLRKNRKFVIIRKINELPLARIFYPILTACLFHVRSFYPWQTPTLLHKAMNLVTCRQ